MNLRVLTARTLGTNVIATFLGFVASIGLSHWLGPSGRGEFAAATLWPMLLVYIASMGQFVAIRYYASLPNADVCKLCTNALLFAVIQSIIFIPLGYFFLPMMLKSQRVLVIDASRLFLWVIPISLITQNYANLIQGRMHITAVNWLSLITPVGYVVGIALLYFTHNLKVFPFVYMNLVLNCLSLIGTLSAAVILGFRLTKEIDRSLIKIMLGYGLKVQVGDIAGTINLRLNQTLLAAWMPPAQLGLYVAANSAVLIAQLLSGAVKTVTVPSIGQQPSIQAGEALLERCFRKYWVLSLIIALTLAVVLPKAVPLVFGESFRPAVWPAEILLVATLLAAAKDVLYGGVQALGKPWLGSQATLFAVIITVTLLPTLIRYDGIMGAAVATLVTYIGELAIFLYFLYRSTGIASRRLFFINISEAKQLFLDLQTPLISRPASKTM